MSESCTKKEGLVPSGLSDWFRSMANPSSATGLAKGTAAAVQNTLPSSTISCARFVFHFKGKIVHWRSQLELCRVVKASKIVLKKIALTVK